MKLKWQNVNVYEYSKKKYAILSGYIGVHKVVTVDQVLNIDFFGYPNQWVVVMILEMILKVFILGEYRTILHTKLVLEQDVYLSSA